MIFGPIVGCDYCYICPPTNASANRAQFSTIFARAKTNDTLVVQYILIKILEQQKNRPVHESRGGQNSRVGSVGSDGVT